MDFQVYGISDDRMGEEICASVTTKEDSTITSDEIKAYCKGKVSIISINQSSNWRQNVEELDYKLNSVSKIIVDRLV